MTSNDTYRELIDELVISNHVLYDHNVCDCYGHLSARHPSDPGKFLMSWAVAPGIVTAEDILTYALEGNVLDGSGQEIYSERHIHGGIYAARPDVMGVVHSHSLEYRYSYGFASMRRVGVQEVPGIDDADGRAIGSNLVRKNQNVVIFWGSKLGIGVIF
jgi:hypothetical protein